MTIDALRGLVLRPTLGVGLVLLACFQRLEGGRVLKVLSQYGSAPMFFYLLRLLVPKALYLTAVQVWGLNQGAYYGFDTLTSVWLWSAGLAVALYLPTRWFAELKQRRRDIGWLKYC